jgi:hypothetical protein
MRALAIGTVVNGGTTDLKAGDCVQGTLGMLSLLSSISLLFFDLLRLV